MESRKTCIARAEDLTLRAAQWLALLKFQTRPGAPIFMPGITTYQAMFDPAASDDERRAACNAMLPAVRRQVELERWKGEDARVSIRSVRRSAMTELQRIAKDGEAGEDEVGRAEKELEGTTATYVAKIDDMVKAKETELLEV